VAVALSILPPRQRRIRPAGRAGTEEPQEPLQVPGANRPKRP